MSLDGADTILCSPTQECLTFVRSEKLFLLASSIAGLPTTGFPYGGIYEKASSATGRLPCFMALSVHGPVWACVMTADSKMNNATRLWRIAFPPLRTYRLFLQRGFIGVRWD